MPMLLLLLPLYDANRTARHPYPVVATGGGGLGLEPPPLCGKCDGIFCRNMHKNALFLLKKITKIAQRWGFCTQTPAKPSPLKNPGYATGPIHWLI